MPANKVSLVSELLHAWSHGDKNALEDLVPLVYPELHRIANRLFADQRADHTLQPSALVNELYLRFETREGLDWRDRAHFLAIAATEMRRILITHARKKGAGKRGFSKTRVFLTDIEDPAGEPRDRVVDLLVIDEALTRLEAMDPESCQIVVLRYFGGLSTPEVARVLGVTERTVYRRWAAARAWLYNQLNIPRSADDVAAASGR